MENEHVISHFYVAGRGEKEEGEKGCFCGGASDTGYVI